jgi:ABC-type multidrug transport system fused ATPase/permease subunit
MYRLLSEVVDKAHEIEIRLVFGATKFESSRPTIKAAIKAALMPSLNTMAVVGLVSIPGMMTGQLLGGASPLVAAEYQMVILWLIFGTAALSTLSSLLLCSSHAVFDGFHRLTPARIIKTGGKVDIDKALYQSVISGCKSLIAVLSAAKDWMLRGAPALDNSRGYSVAETEVTELPVALGSSSHGLIRPPSPGGLCKASYRVVDNNPMDNTGDEVALLELRDYNVLCGEVPLFGTDGLNLDLRQGEVLTVEGSSGIGKSRHQRSLSMLDVRLSGSIKSGGAESVSNGDDVPLWRSRCIYVPQVGVCWAGAL